MSFETDLEAAVNGEVRFGRGDRAMYASDSSNYRLMPRGAFIPLNVEEIVTAIKICAQHDVPIVHRGGGTALAGQTIGTNALIIDSSKYCNAIISLDPEKRVAVVEPGCVLDDLRDAAGKYGLTFGPDPSTHNHCTLGGMIGNNSCGVHSIMAGRTLDNVVSLEIVTYDGTRMTVGKTSVAEMNEKQHKHDREGEIYRDLWNLQERHAAEIRARTPDIPRLVSGYRLEQLLPENSFHIARALVGSESTCVTILRATLQLVPDPDKELIVTGFDSMAHAADAVPDILKMNPAACEAMDHRLISYMKKKNFHTDALEVLPEGKAWLLIEAQGDTSAAAREHAKKIKELLEKSPHDVSCRIVESEQKISELWEVRKSGLGATAWVPGMKRATWPGWEDSAVHPDRIGEYTRKLRALLDSYDYHASMYGHFGDGLIHMRVDFGLETEMEVEKFRNFMGDASDLVIKLGGTLSGEHGDGQARSELLPKMYGETMMKAFAEFKTIWDPANKMNPGNIIAPRKMVEDLRFGPQFKPEKRETIFKYPEDHNDFRHAAIRCVGVGECRRSHGGTMCPSYRATREEKHSTRGRARLFQEMLQGDPLNEGWKSDEIREALDLCLSCKACKSECPVNVDMATYKAEFYHHYYQGKSRPLTHYTIGNIPTLARLAALMPAAANFAASIKWAKNIIGVHGDRKIPSFANTSFRRTWKCPIPGDNGRVILWTDTFNNYFSPHVLQATADVLAQTGYRIEIPKKNLCCGRPYYDFGMLDKAEKKLRDLMENLAFMDEQTWIVGTEPSCISVFKDELINIFPNDPRAQWLKEHSMMLGDFLKSHTDYRAPRINRKIIAHGHCHHKTLLGISADNELLKDTGAELDILDSGCCGMAGSFGYEKEKYPHSVAIANQVLLPAIRTRAQSDIIVTNGFSCRTQIADLGTTTALTLPELLMKFS